ncbi:acyltransferase [Photobacterium carnosum]|uniref:hypothetical protein n=1 Tax=Photobacterium carnosum TaxID=2023717 RepID=UPI001F1E7F51|nr:hypothetical protein [Photobacterium carnosum]MCF2155407.1 acyltransferase [Photobacterium carnosum]MCF2217227.1 acyltransferase [Photobacterium carnosum]
MRERNIIYITKIHSIISQKIRNYFYSKAFNIDNCNISKGAYFKNSKNIEIKNFFNSGSNLWMESVDNGVIKVGNNVSFSQNVHVAALNRVEIGNGVLVGSDVLITDHEHGINYKDIINNIPPKDRELTVKGSTLIRNNVWISDNVKVLSGVTIGENSIIGANSVVTRNIPSNSVAVGIPCRVIRRLGGN